jgi:crotonobetainyl-CoA:carnitine CoA-transferase CaiB-like acyl-CoA transferase
VGQFSGLKVLELASVLAGPSVGQFFAELGAEVIKVENLKTGGDVTRSWKTTGENTDDRSAYFCSVNWGKKSIAIDLSSGRGQKIVQQLASTSDIVIASYKPGDAEKLGVDFKTLSEKNQGLIYGQITGYGSKNRRVGYDAILQAEAGFMYMNGEPGGVSLKMPVALIDVLAGHHLKEGLLLAMLEKNRTGKGKLVEVSLMNAAVSSLVNQATNWLMTSKLPQKKGSAHPNIAPYGDVFLTADKKELILAVGTDGQFAVLCSILEINDYQSFLTNPLRLRHKEELNQILQQKIFERNSAELMRVLESKNVPAGIIKNMQEVFNDPEVKRMVLTGDQVMGLRTLAVDEHIESGSTFNAAPHFGEHSFEILHRIGLRGEDINALASKNIIFKK